MNVYFVYKVLTNRIRDLIRAAGYILNSSGHVTKLCTVWGHPKSMAEVGEFRSWFLDSLA